MRKSTISLPCTHKNSGCTDLLKSEKTIAEATIKVINKLLMMPLQ